MLQDLISGLENSKFDIEDALDKQLGARPLPFPGMDSECKGDPPFFPDMVGGLL